MSSDSSSDDDDLQVLDPGPSGSGAKTPAKTPAKTTKRPLDDITTPSSAAKKARTSVTKSKLWNFFDRSDNKLNLTCRLCKINCRTKHSSTGPMHSHMKVHHPDEYADYLLQEAKDEKDKV
jgi:hypothetical protein